jgi:hypothetical protein
MERIYLRNEGSKLLPLLEHLERIWGHSTVKVEAPDTHAIPLCLQALQMFNLPKQEK